MTKGKGSLLENKLGINLLEDWFSHFHLYVALSRAMNPSNIVLQYLAREKNENPKA